MGREASKSVLLRRSGAVVELVPSRPQWLNAIDDGVAAVLLQGLELVAGEPGCRLPYDHRRRSWLLLRPGPPERPERPAAAPDRSPGPRAYIPLVTAIQLHPIPVLAAVNGVAAGAGFAQEPASGPTKAFALTKQAFREALRSNLGAELELEADLQQQGYETADFREGLLAFRQKRPRSSPATDHPRLPAIRRCKSSELPSECLLRSGAHERRSLK